MVFGYGIKENPLKSNESNHVNHGNHSNHSINGEIEVILIHIEIQGSYEKDFAERMLIYYLRIYEKYRCPITSIAILTDESKRFEAL